MKNKTLATLTFVSFAIIFLAFFAGDMQDLFYGAGAIGTLVFGGLTLSRLYQNDKHDKFPYIGGGIMLVFWIFALIMPGGLQLLGIFYLASGLYGAGKLYQLNGHASSNHPENSLIKKS